MFSENGSNDDSMDLISFLMDLPLRSFFHFQEGSLTQPPDDITNMLLDQVRGVKA